MKEEFVANVVHVEMQHCHMSIVHHTTKATNVARVVNATTTYQIKHDIVNSDMV
jgi:hypothetical protein